MNFMSDEFPMTLEREAGLPENVPPVSVSFGPWPMLDKAKSQEAGHDVYVDVVHVRIAIPGERSSLYFQPATDQHKRRFPRAWQAYQNRSKDGVREGLPIEQWAPISRSIAMTLRSINIDTVEALAAVHDGHIGAVPNGVELRAKAQAWLEQAKDSAATLKLAAEKKAADDRIAALEAQLRDLANRVPVEASVKSTKARPAPVAEPDEAEIEQDVVAAARRPRVRA